MDELKTHYVESMEATGEMTQAEAEERFGRLVADMCAKFQRLGDLNGFEEGVISAKTLSVDEWETKRNDVAQAVWEGTTVGKDEAAAAAAAAMTALGFTCT